MENEIERTFLEWTVEEVVQWLQKLSLSQDYSDHFKGTKQRNPTSCRLSAIGRLAILHVVALYKIYSNGREIANSLARHYKRPFACAPQ